MRNVKGSAEPHDRLTRMAERMLGAFEADPEYREGDRAIVLLDDKRHGGIGTRGHGEPDDMLDDLLVHLKALFEVHGRPLAIAPIGGEG